MSNYYQQQIDALREGRAVGMSDREILQWVIGLADTASRETGGQGLDPDEFDALIQGGVKTLPAPPLALYPSQAISIEPDAVATGIRVAIEKAIAHARTIQVVKTPAYNLTPAQLLEQALERAVNPEGYKLAVYASSDGTGFNDDPALLEKRLIVPDANLLTSHGQAALGKYAFTLVQTLEWLYECFDQKGWAAIESERDINPLRIAKLGTPEYEIIVCAMNGGGLASEQLNADCITSELNGWLYRAQTGQDVSYVITPAGIRRVGELALKMRTGIEVLSEMPL